MSKTTKPKRAKPDEQPQPQPVSEALILDASQARRELERWQARFYFLATLDPIQFKHFHRRVINSGLSWEEMVDKERGSFPDKGI
ncbi:MAG: hypothetical protein BWY82_01977 [Verrucomicrobia bacterium ADurb.Bin474]|nr:MAG: hypothetical protein BWY82_01977 [Verrucomicrobia bacterium ADurb.Bin474]